MKVEQQKSTVELMIHIYCRHKHGCQQLCQTCEDLLHYAHERLDNCRFAEDKGSCKHCSSHCYKPSMRKQIRLVMRFTGPRMIFYAPLQTIKHLTNIWK